jgi:hypothetical protein
MSHERSLFQLIASATSPDWNVHLTDHMQPGAMNLGEHSARIYAVDVRTGWIGAGCMAPNSMLIAAQHLKERSIRGGKLQDEACQWVKTLSAADAISNNPDIEKCLTVVAAALTDTTTFNLAKSQGIAGHWIYMIYNCRDGSHVSRPVFARSSQVGGAFIEPDVLNSVIARVISQDHSPTSSVAKQLTLGGGTEVAEVFGGPLSDQIMQPQRPRPQRPQ